MGIREIIILVAIVIVGAGCHQTIVSQNERPQKAVEDNSKKYNVVFITLSSLRADHVSAYGYHRNTTPHFDAFAQNSVLFENAFAVSSWQMPVQGTLLTSLYPSQHGATHINKKLKKMTTLPAFLKARGYYTAGVCFNPRLTEDNGFAQGFDFYDDYSANMMLETLHGDVKSNAALNVDQTRTNDLVNDVAIRWIRNNTHFPFFLFIHYYDIHWDYLPPEPYDTLYDAGYNGTIDGARISKEPLYSNKPSDRDVDHIIALYDGEVRQGDEDLGVFLDLLKTEGRFKDSVILVMADHGEQFYEHGNTSHHGLYDEMIRIPMAMSIPNQSTKHVSSLISSVDVMPTLINTLNIPVPDTCMGKSLFPFIDEKTGVNHDPVFLEYTGGAVTDVYAARSMTWKYVQSKDSVFAFNIKEDSQEQKPLSKEMWPIEVNELQDYCAKIISQIENANDKVAPGGAGSTEVQKGGF